MGSDEQFVEEGDNIEEYKLGGELVEKEDEVKGNYGEEEGEGYREEMKERKQEDAVEEEEI